MPFYGRAAEAATKILEAFQHPHSLPAALAPVFIRRKDDVPCRQWSWSNQLLAALSGYSDARGFRQWKQVERKVKKGERGFPILVPLSKRVTVEEDNGESAQRSFLYGFKHTIVFGLEQTDGKPLPPADPEIHEWIESLPLLDVARHWGITVEVYSGRSTGPLGKFRFDGHIALGVENLATWSHEMVHAADHRLGRLKELGQHWRSETVAELGGATLLTILGHDGDADLGGCWDYIQAYARDAKVEPVAACQTILKRTCDAVASILDTAEEIASTNSAPDSPTAQPVAQPNRC